MATRSERPASPGGRRLPRSWFDRGPLAVAPDLLNKVIEVGERAARIVEVEAYLGLEDPASHAHRGPTPRTQVMFGPPGRLYVYLSYGIHWCANVVTGPDGVAGAVLLRAAEPLRGIEAMRAERPRAKRDVDLANGPGKLGSALGLGRSHTGLDLCRPGAEVTIRDDGTAPPTDPRVGPRIGISVATDRPWRFSVPGSPHRSRPR